MDSITADTHPLPACRPGLCGLAGFFPAHQPLKDPVPPLLVMIFRRGLGTGSRQINETLIRPDATSLSPPLTFHSLPGVVWTPCWILSAATFMLVWLQRVSLPCVCACVCVSAVRGALAELITLAKLLPVHCKDCPCVCVCKCV